VGFRDGGRFSELPYARRVAEQIGAQHNELGIGADEFIGSPEDFVWHMNEPQADLNAAHDVGVLLVLDVWATRWM
jgi:asparagine synthase (glutamine-hydrolysing)